MQDARNDAQGGQYLHATDAEQQLLADAHPEITAVKPRGEIAIFVGISFDIGVE